MIHRSLLLALTLAAPSLVLAQQQGGNLAPGAIPGVTMKSLDKIDPGTALEPADFGVTGITISTPGYYYLTGNVTTVPGTEVAISVTADNVNIDLRGFAIISSGGTGVNFFDSAILAMFGPENISVRNGSIEGGWDTGVSLIAANGSTVENVHVRGTNATGIQVGKSALIKNCHVDGGEATGSGFVSASGITVNQGGIVKDSTALRCDGIGIKLDNSCAAYDCAALDNGDSGFSAGFGSTISRCMSSSNASDGFSVGDGASVLNCVAFNNDGNGIDTGSACTISVCTGYDNGGDGINAGLSNSVSNCAARSNDLAGIVLGSASAASDCTANQNTGDGFAGGSQCRIRDCVAYSNDIEGFAFTANNVITGCVAFGNGDNGFSGLSGNIFSMCVSRSNGFFGVKNAAADGFEINNANRIRDCIADNSEGAGIRATSNTNDLRDNYVHLNKSGGIDVPSTLNLLIGNYSLSNSSFNISPGPGGNIGPTESASTGTSSNANF